MSWAFRPIGWKGAVAALFVAVACGPVGCGGKSSSGTDGGGGSGNAGGSSGGGRAGAGGRGGGGAGTTGSGGGSGTTGAAGGGGTAGGGGGVTGSGGGGTTGGAGVSGAGGGAGSAGGAGVGGASGGGGASGNGGRGGAAGGGTGGGGSGGAGTGGGGTSGGGTGGSAGTGIGPLGPAWTTPENVDMQAMGHAIGGLAIDMDAAGNATALWRHSNAAGGVFSIYANRFAAASKTWGTSVPLETDDVYGAAYADLDVDAAGNAIVVWRQQSGRYESIWANGRAAAGAAWSTATLLETYDSGEAESPHVAATGGGSAVAVWYQWDGTRQSIYANRLDAVAGAWEGRVLLETTDTMESLYPDVAADADGNAVAVWEETDAATLIQVRAARRDRTTGMWSASVPLGGPGVRAPALAALPKVAVHAITGDAIAVWILRTGTIDSVWASRFHRVSGTWAGAVLLETDDRGHASQPEVAIDARGDAVAVWRQHDGTNYDIWANRFLASSGTWSGPVRLDASDLEARSPVVSAAGDGHAVVVWMQRSGIGSGYDIRAGRFNPTAGTWGLPSLLDAADVTADSPQVAIDSAGNAIAIWSQLMGSWYELMAARHPAN